jgi:hypothetical protein
MRMNPKNFKTALSAFLFILFCAQSAHAVGRRITITLLSGLEVKGELLSVHEKSLIVTKVYDVSDWELTDHPEFISAVSQQDIRKVFLQGKSDVLGGMGIGLLVGALGGVIVGGPAGNTGNSVANTVTKPAFALGGAVIFGLGGLLVGALIGGASSAGSEVIPADRLQDLFYFRQYARYQENEPDFLKNFDRQSMPAGQRSSP